MQERWLNHYTKCWMSRKAAGFIATQQIDLNLIDLHFFFQQVLACQRTSKAYVASVSGELGFPRVWRIFRLLNARKLGRTQKSALSFTLLRSPQFSRCQKAKNASNGRKTLAMQATTDSYLSYHRRHLWKLYWWQCLPIRGRQRSMHELLIVCGKTVKIPVGKMKK